LTIQVAGPAAPSAVDLMLPADHPVAELIPSIVDVAHRGSGMTTDPQRWHLTRIGGDVLDGSKTLRENAVHDGELILAAAALLPLPYRRSGDPSGVVAGVASQFPPGIPQGAAPATCLTVTAISAATLAWSGSTGGTSAHLWTAATLSAATATGAIVIGRRARQLSLVLSVGAVVFATVAGFLAVPDAPWAHYILLAASAGFAVSILLLRMVCGGTVTLTALAVQTGTVATVGAIGVATAPTFETAGATLTVLSLAALSAAPKLTVAVAGLGPSRPVVGDERAAIAHRILTGLVVGWSSSAALGVAAVAAAAVQTAGPTAVAVLFAADVGLLLLLRQRTHLDVRRRIALAVAGIAALIAAHTIAVSSAPGQAYVICAVAVVASIAGLHWTAAAVTPNPVVRQSIQAVEYLALAAVVPLAAWVTGVYGLVRDLSLT
jgi:type VII secretion integral membrane protein EccD